MTRDLLATLLTALFALGAILLCATQATNWTLSAAFEATAAFLLAFVALTRHGAVERLLTKNCAD